MGSNLNIRLDYNQWNSFFIKTVDKYDILGALFIEQTNHTRSSSNPCVSPNRWGLGITKWLRRNNAKENYP